MGTNWTQEQKQAIFDSKGTLLVSAAAGSGKTAVLVERIITKIMNQQHPIDADRLLVATFSNAAASEMKERILARLALEIKKNPKDLFLKHQEILLSKAYISTIHAFCLDIIKKNFHVLGIPHDIRIGDEKELDILYNETATQVIEAEYGKGDENFIALVEMMSSGQDDKNLKNTLLNMYQYIRSHSFYNEWLSGMLSMYTPTKDVFGTAWGSIIHDYCKESVNHLKLLVQLGVEGFTGCEVLEKGYEKQFAFAKKVVQNLEEHLVHNNWNGCYEVVNNLKFPAKGRVTDPDYADDKEFLSDTYDKIKDVFSKLKNKIFIVTDEEFAEDITFLYPRIQAFFTLVTKFDEALYKCKERKKLMDFSDIEHYTLKLLYENTADGFVISDIAKEYQQRFDMVIVDEYQDTNEAQEMIFESISQDDNRFMVGDLKQSIYRFRQAMPEIFLKKKKEYTRYDGENYPATIIFNRNFRSRKQVTDYVNLLFGDIMSEDVGDIPYEGEETLKPAASYPPAEDMEAELHIVCPAEEEDANDAEASHVAQEIQKLIKDQFLVTKNGNLVPVEPKDIAILLRSPKKKAATYVKALGELGIEAISDSRREYLNSVEISSVVSLLRVISNPTRDISVAAAMLSPIFGFSTSKLAQIRLKKDKNLYIAAINMAQEGDEDCQFFIEKVKFLRQVCATLPSSVAIQRILDDTDIIPIVSCMNNAESRVANLYMLVDYAKQCESMGYQGIDGLVTFVEKLEENDSDLDSATNISEGTNAVRIMSIHRSKGLEFPVVFLCNTAKNFNKQDINASTMINSALGFATARRDPQSKKQYTTIPLEAVRLEEERASLSEEMRVLYVALTRAKEKLFITAVQNNPAKQVERALKPVEAKGKVSAFDVRMAKSYADWMFMSAVLRANITEITSDIAVGKNTSIRANDEKFIIKYYFADKIAQIQENTTKTIAHWDEEAYSKMKSRIAWNYPYWESTKIPSLMSVSRIVGKDMEESLFSAKPSFLEEESLSSAEKGTAFHNFMKYARYNDAKNNFEAEMLRLVEQKFITNMQAESIKKENVLAVLNSKLFTRISKADWFAREYEFLVVLGEEDTPLLSGTGKEKISVQGVADAVFMEEDSLVIVDYKTDRVLNANILKPRYANQISLYALAIEKVTGKKVKEKILYSVPLGTWTTV